jgi:hypothetical protein
MRRFRHYLGLVATGLLMFFAPVSALPSGVCVRMVVNPDLSARDICCCCCTDAAGSSCCCGPGRPAAHHEKDHSPKCPVVDHVPGMMPPDTAVVVAAVPAHFVSFDWQFVMPQTVADSVLTRSHGPPAVSRPSPVALCTLLI